MSFEIIDEPLKKQLSFVKKNVVDLGANFSYYIGI